MRKKAIVTGGSRGIGRGIVKCLIENGYDVVFSYNTKEEEAKNLVDDVKEKDVHVFYIQSDMSVLGNAELFFDEAVKQLGGLDLLVNNAGITVFDSILDINTDDILKIINLDLISYLILSNKAAMYMKENKIRGNIINITSSRAERAYPEDSVYGGVKAAINRASKSMALDLATYGIRVNCVAPGAVCIRTPEEIQREHLVELENFWENLGSKIPLERNGKPEDIGNAVVFLASEKASYITGEILRVDGGLILPGMPEKDDNSRNVWGGVKL